MKPKQTPSEVSRKMKIRGNIASGLSIGALCLIYMMHRFELAPSLSPPFVQLAIFCTVCIILAMWVMEMQLYSSLLDALTEIRSRESRDQKHGQ